MPEGFQIKAMGTIEYSTKHPRRNLKKIKCKAINHALMGQENLTRANKHTLGLWALGNSHLL